MTLIPAGTEVSYTTTWLEMTERPGFPWPATPVGSPVTLLHATAPPAWYFLSLYDAVGRDYVWDDMFEMEEADLRALLHDADVALWTLFSDGWPHGFFLLDWRKVGICDLAYFGLVPQAVGRGLGRYLLQTAIHTGWDRPGVAKMTVNTCTLDHPRALVNYQKHGFVPVRQAESTRILKRDRDLARIPD
ncbi:GNAT family N-acetyltransferase [Maritimibacter sp. 55A14]|uniref:GNAT family N-acetyltransferase n=1 Tax=Maritimibacter sp. 55A14 TaxID=2174844 RepID=UPI001304E901|nr:GNAT family N-acetyltransferase [Maritimibacter sp. 55A14]